MAYRPRADKVLPLLVTETNLKTMNNLLHLVPTQVQIALNEVAVNKADNWLCLLVCVKRPPADTIVNRTNELTLM